MKKRSSFNTALVRLCDVIQPPASEYLRDTPLYHLVYQDVELYYNVSKCNLKLHLCK
jgi:hypothetical protein